MKQAIRLERPRLRGAARWVLCCGLLASCGGNVNEVTAEVPEACQGAYTGTFGGDVRGTLTGSLSSNATFSVTFTQTSTSQSASGSGKIAEDGSIAFSLGPNEVTGSFNFGRCRATGDWVSGETSGTWRADRR